jgi:hypothetical protein
MPGNIIKSGWSFSHIQPVTLVCWWIVYLGAPFNVDGIAWRGHRFKRPLMFSGIWVAMEVDLTQPPVWEFSSANFGIWLALCPLGLQHLAKKPFASALRPITSGGRSSSAFTLGLFGEMQPVSIRMLSLHYRFYQRIYGKDSDHSIYYARKAYESRRIPSSVFSKLKKNLFVKLIKMESRDAAFQHRLPSVCPLADLEDELIRRECRKYKLHLSRQI